MFKQYMDKTYRGRHLDSFRYKNPYEISTYAFSFTDGKRINGQLDPFFNSFLRGRSFRESCYSCNFACPERIGDITLGDCANFRAYPSLAGKPLSTILINSPKGRKMWEGIREEMRFVDADYAKESQLNHQLNSPTRKPKERNFFYADLIALSSADFSKKYAEHWDFKMKLKRFLITHIPYSLRSRFR
jgi:coenzyme F420-reducing hydrogenase beta subunit